MCCVVVCDLETLRMGAPYIYDISRLRVKGRVGLPIPLLSLLAFVACSTVKFAVGSVSTQNTRPNGTSNEILQELPANSAHVVHLVIELDRTSSKSLLLGRIRNCV